jgi:hypothetical protein
MTPKTPQMTTATTTTTTTTTTGLEPPPPHRSDEAFARAVRADIDDVRAARVSWRLWWAAPLTAAAALGVVWFSRGPSVEVPTPDRLAALIEAEVDARDERVTIIDVVAAVDAIEDDEALAFLAGTAGSAGSAGSAPAFAFADLDGSSEQDLAAVEAALDRALARL